MQGWAERRDLYKNELELQHLQRDLEQAEHWLNTYENVLTAQDYGVRMLVQTMLNIKSCVMCVMTHMLEDIVAYFTVQRLRFSSVNCFC